MDIFITCIFLTIAPKAEGFLAEVLKLKYLKFFFLIFVQCLVFTMSFAKHLFIVWSKSLLHLNNKYQNVPTYLVKLF